MRKSKLIELLTAIEGNPDIKLWNGYVGDYMDIESELVPTRLVKMTEAHMLEMVRLEQALHDGADPKTFKMSSDEEEHTRACYKKYHEWEHNQFVTDGDIKAKRYKKKDIWILSAKLRGKTSGDRVGTMSY